MKERSGEKRSRYSFEKKKKGSFKCAGRVASLTKKIKLATGEETRPPAGQRVGRGIEEKNVGEIINS